MSLSQLSPEDWEKVLHDIMVIERRYGFERKNITSARRSEVREYLEKYSAEKLEKDLGNEA